MIKFGNTTVGFYASLFTLMLLLACNSSEQGDSSPSGDASDTTSDMVAGNGEDSWIIPSPNKSIQFIIQNQSVEGKAPHLSYRVKFQEELVIEPSKMGLRRKDQDFGENLEFVGQKPIKMVANKANLLHGKRAYISAQANELQLTFKNAEGGKIELIARTYNDGIAFRYRFPESSETVYTVVEELTSFDIPEKGRAWIHPYDSVGKYQPAYETYFEHNLQIGREADGQFNGWAFPALFNVNQSKHWLLLSEAGLDGQYCGTHLQANATNGHYKLSWPLATEAEGQGAAEPSSTLPWTMPWRFITIGANLGTIVESDLVNALAPPSRLSDVSWIQPGMSSWSWWSDSNSPKNYNRLKKFVDLSDEFNWPYTLVDANWPQMKGGDLKKLANYAASKDVGLLVWYNSGGPHNTVTEKPRDLMHEQSTRRAEFKKLQDMGVRGIKVNFWQSDKQWMIQYYLDLLKDAADHQLLVNFHGCTIPRGWSRTYPNLLTMEAVRGGESYKFDAQFTDKAPQLNTILPFTRNVVGPMDYTPLALSPSTHPRKTTMGHELALTVLFESGLTHLVEKPSTLNKLPFATKVLLKYLPSRWDQTKFLLGWPGKDVIIARQSKALWYIAGINGEGKEKKRKLDLRSLGTGILEIEYHKDDPVTGKLKTEFLKTQSVVPIDIVLPPYGGFLLKVRKP